MNRVALLMSFIIASCLFLACHCDDCSSGRSYEIKATIIFINETSDIIKSDGCNRDIAPKSTFKFDIVGTLGPTGIRPDIDNFPTSTFTNCTMMYIDGNILKCEQEMEVIENYENRREVSPLVFEFTFRFTEEKKAKATTCN